MRISTLLCAIALCLGACASKSSPDDMSVRDLSSLPQFLLTRTYAAEISANVSLGQDGGAAGSDLVKLLAVMVAYFVPNGDGTAQLNVNWRPCSVALPNQMTVPYPYVLEPLEIPTTNGSLNHPGPGAEWVQNPVSWPIGACMIDPVHDPLPTQTAPLCPTPSGDPKSISPCLMATAAQLPCVFSSKDASGVTWPGVPIAVSGLQPDADVLYIDGRVSFALDAVVPDSQTFQGMPTALTAEWNIVACHLRSGATCSTSDVAQLNAKKPSLSLAGGTVRGHLQQQYFTCPLFLTAPELSLMTLDPLDGGFGIDLGLGTMSFSTIQNDMDQLGCATCHDQFYAPAAMFLVYKPWTEELIRRNYQAVLPWTRADSLTPARHGGRFVNQATSIPWGVQQRWLQWIDQGAPF